MWWPSAVWAVLSGPGGTRLRRDQNPRQDEEAPWELCCRAAPAPGLRISLKSGDAGSALGSALQPGEDPAVSVLQEGQPAGQTDPPATGPLPP